MLVNLFIYLMCVIFVCIVWMCKCVHMNLRAHAYGGQRSTLSGCLCQCLIIWVFHTGSLSDPGSHPFRLTGPQAPGICLSLSPFAGVAGIYHNSQLFSCVLGMQTQVHLPSGRASPNSKRKFVMSESLQLHCSLRKPHISRCCRTSELSSQRVLGSANCFLLMKCPSHCK